MSKRLIILAVLVLVSVSPATAAQIVLTFEDQPDNMAFQTPFPNLYEGVTWTDWRHYAPYEPNGYDPDGVNAIYAAFDGSSFTFSDRVFEGASFSAPFLLTQGFESQIYFELYDNGSLVHTSASLASATLSFLGSGYGGLVDEVRVRTIGPLMTGGGSAWIMDNVTFNTDAAAAPEPSALLLLGAGMVATVAELRRRRGWRNRKK
jgi:hypothetical protein